MLLGTMVPLMEEVPSSLSICWRMASVLMMLEKVLMIWLMLMVEL